MDQLELSESQDTQDYKDELDQLVTKEKLESQD